jgi:RNA polymerase sigma-70 factor (ECF subfamily)
LSQKKESMQGFAAPLAKPYAPDMEDFSSLLDRLEKGDRAALDGMLPAIYAELKELARNYLRRERAGHTLQPTALVHEAYIKLTEQRQVDWRNRAQVLGVAAATMRRVLLHYAETRNADKRGGLLHRVTLDETLNNFERNTEIDFLDLDRALTRLSELDSRQAHIVELRVFGGLNIEETASVLSLSPATIKREWKVAQLWLRRELQ